MTNLVAGTPVTLSSYQTYSYTCMSAGTLTFELWGAGGGGGVAPAAAPTTTPYGGGGGLVTGTLVVAAGDVITGTIGEGGRAGQINVTGGAGGRGASAGGAGGRGTTTIAQGGGGGSSDLKINGTTYAIAGAGAAGTGGRGGGDGGGTSGVAGQGTFAVKGTPGTQTAAGNNGASGGTGGDGFATGNAATANAFSGSGGGAGYWGGGGGRASTTGQYPSAAGGSGYVNTAALITSSNTAGSAGVSPSSAHKPSNAGNGGTSVSNGTGGNTSGFDGALYLSLEAFTTLPTTKTNVSYSGGIAYYQSPGEGTLTVKLWGGGGGGGSYTSTALASQGGGGGYLTTKIVLHTDDVVQIWVGQGGRGAASTTVGGNVAYPDGGYGGSNVTAGFAGGGGGGSTRVYVNGVLKAIAGAGGGGRGTGANAANETTHGGAGGGLDGGKGYKGSTTVTGASGGQTGSASNPAGQTAQDGSSLQGGKGHNLAYGTVGGSGNTTGGAGGGGYQGGSGGGSSSVTSGGGGGGGSSWSAATNLSVTNIAGVTSGTVAADPGNAADADRPSGVGQGGLGVTSGAAGAGGNGAAIIVYSDGVPGDADGLVGTIAMTVSAGTGQGNAATSGLLSTVSLTALSAGILGIAAGLVGTISLTVPAAVPGLGATATGDFGPAITNNGDELGGQGFADALITVPFMDYDLTIAAPEAYGGVSTTVTKPMPGPISMAVPKAIIYGYTEGPIGTITLATPEGAATERVEAPGLIGTIILDIFDAVAAGNANAHQDANLNITLSAAAASAYALTSVSTEPFANDVNLTAPEATTTSGAFPMPGPILLESFDATTAIGPIEVTFGPAISLVAPGGNFGAAAFGLLPSLSMVSPNGYFNDGTVRPQGDVGTIALTAPKGDFSYNATGMPLDPIILSTVDGEFWDGTANPSGDIGTITLTPGEGEFNYIGYGEPLSDIVLTAPDATGGGDGDAAGELETIVLTSPEATSEGEVSFTGPIGTIILTPPVFAPVRGATILASIIPAKISLKSPTGVAGLEIAVVADADFGDLAISMGSPEGYVYVDSPGWAAIRLKRSEVSGEKPGSLAVREVAVNEADGVFFTRDGDGLVRGTPLVAIQRGAEVPTEGDTGTFLRGDTTWGYAQPQYTDFARQPIQNGYVMLSDVVLDGTDVTLTPDLIYYHPFFVPKTVVLSNLSINVVSSGLGMAHIGVCKWSLPQTPDITVISGSAPPSSTGTLAISGSVTLTPGWYAAMVAVTEAGIVLNGYKAPAFLASDFTLAGDPTGVFVGDLDSLGSPTGRASNSTAFLRANSTNV